MKEIYKKKMLLVGPGHGHNVEGKLSSLIEQSLFEVTFLATHLDHSLVAKYPQIRFVEFDFAFNKSNPLKILSTFWTLLKYARFKEKYDVIYVLGLGSIIIATLFFFSKKQTKRALELWSNSLIDTAKHNKNLLGSSNRYILKKVDYVCQYWWGIREKFITLFPQYEHKFLMYQLSYSDVYFSDEKHQPESEFVKQFLSRIPDNQIVCFWPRSFNASNNHPVLLDAIGLIRREDPGLLVNFKLYLWVGNVEDIEARRIIEEKIKQQDIVSYVEIIKHPFVPQNDIFAIEERSNFFVNIVNDDILSTYIMEMICSCRPFVLSNIRTFQFLNEKYGLNINLVDNTPSLIADKIKDILLNRNQPSYSDFIARKEACKKYFDRTNVTRWYKILYDKL